jgi:hypothetical protein
MPRQPYNSAYYWTIKASASAPCSARWMLHCDKSFKFGISWDTIRGLGVTDVLLFHFGPFVLSRAKNRQLTK